MANVTANDLRYTITSWKGNAFGALSEYDIHYTIAPKDAKRRVDKIFLNMQFLNRMNTFFQSHPHQIVLRCSEKTLTIPQIIKVIDAYERAVNEHNKLLAGPKRSNSEFKTAVERYEAIEDPLLSFREGEREFSIAFSSHQK